jgi:uncharacterized protein YggU (UPF0235/DUF167 family)
VKVVPASSRTRIAGWLGDSLKIRVTAKPEKGKANEAVSAVLAEALAIPNSEISLSSGSSSAIKVLKINMLSNSEIRARLPDHDD